MRAVRLKRPGLLLPALAATAAVLLVLAASSSDTASLAARLAGGLLVIAAAWIAVVDARSFTIPDAALALMAAAALALRLEGAPFAIDPVAELVLAGMEAVLAGGSILLVRETFYRRRGIDGIGFGDVKLAAVGGLLCGLFGFSVAVLAASLAGLALAALPMLRGAPPLAKLPFGALLAPAFLIAFAWGI